MLMHRAAHGKNIYLPVTSARRNEEKQQPFPELIPWKTVDGHVSKISPQN